MLKLYTFTTKAARKHFIAAVALVFAMPMLVGCDSGTALSETSATSDKSGLYGYSDYMIAENINPEVYVDTLWKIDIKDPDAELPDNFRTSYTEPSVDNAKKGMDESYAPSADGLGDTLMSGSSEFNEDQLTNLIAEIRKYHDGDICIIDLRQESHLFVNGISLSRYGLRDWGNLGMDPDDVKKDEKAFIKSLGGQTIDAYTLDDDKQPQEQELIVVESAKTEQEIVESQRVEYYRLPCTDHVCLTDEEIDAFIAFVRNLDDDTWLHFHCEAGKGRTTYVMAFYDMMLNPDLSLKDIAYRQCEIGGNYILNASGDDWKDPYYAEKAEQAELFYQYVQENYATDYVTPFSEWHTRSF